MTTLEGIGFFALLVGLAAAWVWAAVGGRVWRQRQRNALAEKLARDEAPPDGPFAVYLRPFRYPAFIGLETNLGEQLKNLILSKSTGADGANGVRGLEGALADLLGKDLPLVGLGRPQAGLRESGAGLIRATDAEWQTLISSLLDRCSAIVMAPSATKGTAWEIEHIAANPAWRAKTIYFMPNFQIELIRALQPRVAGYEAIYGTGKFIDRHANSRPTSLIALSLWLIVKSAVDLVLAFLRVAIDVSFAVYLLSARIGKSLQLRTRWAAARRVARAHGLNLPRYAGRGRLFRIGEDGRAHVLADLRNADPKDIRRAILDVAKHAAAAPVQPAA